MKNRDLYVALPSFFLVAALTATSGCAVEDPSNPMGLNSESFDGGAFSSQPLPPRTDARRPPDSRSGDPGGFLVCDPSDNRYCKVSRAEDGVSCPERVEGIGQWLTCGQIGGNTTWTVQQGPGCVIAEWFRQLGDEHRETCVYDTRTGRLVLSRGQDACGIYCGGLRAVHFGETYPEACSNTRLVGAAECRADGTEVPVPIGPPGRRDAGARDSGRAPDARRPFDARPVDASNQPPYRTFDAQPPPPPPPQPLYDAQPPPPPVVL